MISNEKAIYLLENAAWLGTNEEREEIEQAVEIAVNALKTTSVKDKDLISRQAAIDFLHEYFDSMLETDTVDATIIYHGIELLPPTQPEEASMILGQSKDGVMLWYQCSACGELANADDNYCCNCGRKFRNG